MHLNVISSFVSRWCRRSSLSNYTPWVTGRQEEGLERKKGDCYSGTLKTKKGEHTRSAAHTSTTHTHTHTQSITHRSTHYSLLWDLSAQWLKAFCCYEQEDNTWCLIWQLLPLLRVFHFWLDRKDKGDMVFLTYDTHTHTNILNISAVLRSKETSVDMQILNSSKRDEV